MAQKKKVTVKQILDVVDEHNGNIAAIARSFGVTRTTVQRRVDESPKLTDALASARETMIDEAESQLYKNAKAGDNTAIIFFLKTQGKKRGYVERQEVTGAEGGPVKVEGLGKALDKVYGKP
ncbi:hypothetical protein DRH14_04740 [Candidatus Shapirobacteria bacterium]|nr:MAG: hypothetical protein DRH14_04740 [Candidatus Shapirobacteria bacterium]